MLSGSPSLIAPVSGAAQTTSHAIDATVRRACNQVQARWAQPTLLFDGECWYADGCSRLIYGAELHVGSSEKLMIEASTDRLPYPHRRLAGQDLERLALRLCALLGMEVEVLDPWCDPVYAHCTDNDEG
jgi:hypothetical protein